MASFPTWFQEVAFRLDEYGAHISPSVLRRIGWTEFQSDPPDCNDLNSLIHEAIVSCCFDEGGSEQNVPYFLMAVIKATEKVTSLTVDPYRLSNLKTLMMARDYDGIEQWIADAFPQMPS